MKLAQAGKKYYTDHSIVYSCQYHVIFCPKYRRPVLTEEISIKLKELLHNKEREYGYQIIECEIMPEHVHLLLDVNPRVGVHQIVTKIKGYTSRELRCLFPHLKKRLPTLWTRSKFISTVGSVTLEMVQQYIAQQKGV